MLPIHIVAGGLAVIFGFTALFSPKGGPLHRRIGMWFVYSMIAMGVSASILEFRKPQAGVTNLIAAVLCAYFVGTAVTTVRPATRWTRAINITSLIVALTLAAFAILGGVTQVNKPGLSGGGVPNRTIGVMSFVLATALLLSAFGDIRVIRRGVLRGAARLRRHLWRMCFALFIAAGSFFSIRERVAKVLPAPFTTGTMRALPIVILFGAMFFWLWRVRERRAAVRTAGA